MAGCKHQAKQVVADVIIQDLVKIRRGFLALNLVSKFFVLAFEQFVATQEIDGAMLCGGHEPGARFVRYARLRPLLERGHEGLLSEVLRKADITHNVSKPGNQAGRFDPPDRFDRAMSFGSPHSYR